MSLCAVRYAILAPLVGALLVIALPACDDHPSEATSPDAGLDTTMPSTCGNGLIEVGEACDGADRGGQSCASLGLGEGPVGCPPTCLFDITACGASLPACGGQVCADGEVCDAANGVCVCAGGHHACGDRCVPDDDVLTCGQRCEPCPEVAGGGVTCTSGVCGTRCDPGTLACGGTCAPCDDPKAETFGREGVFGVDGVAHHATRSGTTWTLTSIAGPRVSTDEASGSLVVDASGRVIVGYRHEADIRDTFSLFEP